MSIRKFATVDRGMVDKPLVCVFSWEIPILEEIFGDVQVHTVEELSSTKGAALLNKIKLRHAKEHAPDLKAQITQMLNTVPDEVNPLESPESEFARLSQIYGMHPEHPILAIEVVYGRFNEGRFTKAVKDAFEGKTSDDGDGEEGEPKVTPEKPLDPKMVKEALTAWGVQYAAKEKNTLLAEKYNIIKALKDDDTMEFDVNAPIEELRILFEALP